MIHPTTLIKIKVEEDEKIIQVYDLQYYLNKKVYILSPDGWVEFSKLLNKIFVDGHILSTDNGFTVQSCPNQNFKTTFGWIPAKEIILVNTIHVNTVKKLSKSNVSLIGSKIPVIGIIVDNSSNRYWANGIELLDDSNA